MPPRAAHRSGLTPGRAAFTLGILAASVTLATGGCRRDGDSAATAEVTLYSSVDNHFLRQIVAAFEKASSIRVNLKGDTEAGKTTGLVRRIEAERQRPQADVFWSSEVFNTIQLAEKGLLAEYRPPADDIPERYRDPQGRWTAFGLRARVLGYNTDKLKPEDVPATWRAIADERWTGQVAVADPVFGTTRGHFAACLALWGEDAYVAWLRDLNRAIRGELMDGNATAAALVGRGERLICATDTDDVYARRERGEPIDLSYPDLGDGGTLLIPNSVAMVEGAPHPEAAKKLIDFLTSAECERLLAESESRNIPVRASLREKLKMPLPPETKVRFQDVADAMNRAIELASREIRR